MSRRDGSGLRRALVAAAMAAIVSSACSSLATSPSGSPASGAPASPGPDGSSGSPAAPGSLAPGPELAAVDAATAVLAATDDRARASAILSVLRGVHLGVYAGDGGAILTGAERGQGDFWIY